MVTPKNDWFQINIVVAVIFSMIRDITSTVSCHSLLTGKLRNSHCPLVIGSFIKDRMTSYFHGYMDNVSSQKTSRSTFTVMKTMVDVTLQRQMQQ